MTNPLPIGTIHYRYSGRRTSFLDRDLLFKKIRVISYPGTASCHPCNVALPKFMVGILYVIFHTRPNPVVGFLILKLQSRCCFNPYALWTMISYEPPTTCTLKDSDRSGDSYSSAGLCGVVQCLDIVWLENWQTPSAADNTSYGHLTCPGGQVTRPDCCISDTDHHSIDTIWKPKPYTFW